MNKFNRVYRRHDEWEEMKHSMWSSVSDSETWLQKAIHFTSNHKRYGHYMRRVVVEWPVSCENALTDYSINRRAWVGHAACALAIGCPEDITRKAWGYLTDEQRTLANKEADNAIKLWEEAYSKNKNVCENMGAPMLF